MLPAGPWSHQLIASLYTLPHHLPRLPCGSVASHLPRSVTDPYLQDEMQRSLVECFLAMSYLVRAREGKERGFPGRPLDCKTSRTCILSITAQMSWQAQGTKKPMSYRTQSQTQCPSLPSDMALSSEPRWQDCTPREPKYISTNLQPPQPPSSHGPMHSSVEFGEDMRSGDGSHGNVTSHSQALP